MYNNRNLSLSRNHNHSDGRRLGDNLRQLSFATELKAAVDAIRFIGVVLAGTGVLGMLVLYLERTGPISLALISTFVVTPGILYVVCASFLFRKKQWAYRGARTMTWVLMILAMLLIVVSPFELPFDFPQKFSAALAGLCWCAALGMVLRSLSISETLIRQEEMIARRGFGVEPTPAMPIQPAEVMDERR